TNNSETHSSPSVTLRKARMHFRSMFIVLVLFITLIQSSFLFCVAQSSDKNAFKEDQIKSLMLKVTNWQLQNPKHNTKDWTNGAFYAGVFAAWETTQSPDIYDALLRMGNTAGWSPNNRFYHADDIAISQTYIDLYRFEKREEMIRPTIDTVNL